MANSCRSVTSQKVIQPANKAPNLIKKKSTEKKPAVPESHKKPDLADRDRAFSSRADKKESVIRQGGDKKQPIGLQERKVSKPLSKCNDKSNNVVKTLRNVSRELGNVEGQNTVIS